MKIFRSLYVLLLFFLTGVCASPATLRPNIVFFLVDDLGWADVGCNGSTFYDTPHIDALATSGMRFTDGYASCPVCSPTRASLMTGKHPVNVGITDWIPGANPKNTKLLGAEDLHELPLAELTIAEALKAGGYSTFFAGKWHLGHEGFYPEDQGFDVNKGGHHAGGPPGGYYSPWKNPRLENGADGEYLTDRLADETIAFMRAQKKQQPFFAYLSFYNVHTPIQPNKKYIEKYTEKAAALPPQKSDCVPEHNGVTRARQDNPEFASMVHAMDENVGRVLAALDELGMRDNTVVVFTSDNGGLATKPKPGPTSNFPLRAGKGWCYEGGIRVATIVRAPGVTAPGSICSVPVYSPDFYPTLLELAELPLRPEQHVDGISLVPVLHGGNDLPRDALYWHYPHYHGSTWAPGASVRMGDWKVIEFYETGVTELYNLKNDKGEQSELSDRYPEKKQELLAKLHAWQKQHNAKMPELNPTFKR
jgi:arylsulfatase A-like enzyme